MYVNDLFILCRSDRVALRNMQDFLDSYSRASSQLSIRIKVFFLFGLTSRYRKVVAERFLEFKYDKAPFVYLGALIFCGKPRRCYLQALADKAKANTIRKYHLPDKRNFIG